MSKTTAIQCKIMSFASTLKKILKRKENLREFTKTSDILLVELTNEDGFKPNQIAHMLDRDVSQVQERIEHLRASGKFDSIHNYLMESNGVYAQRMKRKGRV